MVKPAPTPPAPVRCQEDYLVARRGGFGRLADILIPFLVTRQLIGGAGTVVQTPRGAVFRLSRPAGPAGNALSSITRSRPLMNTRISLAPHRDPAAAVSVSDPP